MDFKFGIMLIGAGILVAFGGLLTWKPDENGKQQHLYSFHGKLGVFAGAALFLLGVINCIFSKN